MVVITGIRKKHVIRNVAGKRKKRGAAYFFTAPPGRARSTAREASTTLLNDYLIADVALDLRRDDLDGLLRCRASRLDGGDASENGVLPLRQVGVRWGKRGVVEQIADLVQEAILDQRRGAPQDR